ncbi:MAG: septal ring lytic transglycosylase RlpA family protein [Bacteroidia bacterium]|nr:septal ring lytic transglycosylase RlpA family protein [Bacteroidia bacterium]
MILKLLLTIIGMCLYSSILKAQQTNTDTLRSKHDTLSLSNTDTSWTITSTTTGVASYYAKRFNGRRTSSGEIFNHQKLTCAHKTLPFGTVLVLTNLRNNKKVTVKVNDRLPQKSKRTVDLTLKAAKELDFITKGLTKVKIEIVK